MIYQFSLSTDPGLSRDNNEDSVVFDNPTQLAVLADGMGGYNAGEVASGMATAFIKSEMSRWLSQAGKNANAREVRRALEICVDNANRSIFNAANSNSQYTGMGTTLVVGVFQEGRLMLGHIGDSRCYRLRGQEFSQITKDHSLLQEQMDAGLITPEQAATSLNKNLVTRALGVEDVVMLETNEHRTEIGDVYLMCSDGLSDMVVDEDIADIMRVEEDLETKAKALVDAANAGGGRDNISVLLVKAMDGQTSAALCRVCLASEYTQQQEPTMPKMIVSIDGVVIKEVQLTKDRTTLGRRPYNDIVIDNLAVSGEHAVIQLAGNDVSLEDLNSTNGTYINGKAVKKQQLANNDTIEIGKYKIKYVNEQQAEGFERTMVIKAGAAGLGTLAPAAATTPVAPASNAAIKVLSGAAAGREVPLVKVVTTIGKPGVAVAAITKRPHGFVVAHVEGSSKPTLNGQPIGAEPVTLKDGDVLELAGTQMQFANA